MLQTRKIVKNDYYEISGYDKLIQLYKEAEIKRKRIQELELLVKQF